MLSKSIAQNRVKQDQLVKKTSALGGGEEMLSKSIAQNRVKQDQLVKKTSALGCGEDHQSPSPGRGEESPVR